MPISLVAIAGSRIAFAPPAAMFDDELYEDISAGVPGYVDDSVAGLSEGTEQFDFELDLDDFDGGSGGSRLTDGLASQTSSTRRRRGHRGSSQKKWRSGHIPAPPNFTGDIESDPLLVETLHSSIAPLDDHYKGVPSKE